MTEETSLVVKVSEPAKPFSAAMFKKIQGLDENSNLKKISVGGVPRLTVKGNKFIIRMGSTEQVIKTGKKPAKELDVVIHDFSPDIQRQLSAPYNSKDPKFVPLGCWSNNGNSPDTNVWNKQSEDCDTCDVKMDCSMNRNLVVSLYSPEGEVEHPMIFTTNWSSNSTNKAGEDMDELLFGLINYLKFLAGHKVETYKVRTRLIIDDWSDNEPANSCKVLFKPLEPLEPTGPNWVAHDKWLAEDADRLTKMIKIEQRPPQDEVVGDSAGADTDEPEVDEDAEAKKAAAAKRRKAAALKKKKEEEAAKLAAQKAAEEEEEIDLGDLGEEELELEDEGDELDDDELEALLNEDLDDE